MQVGVNGRTLAQPGGAPEVGRQIVKRLIRDTTDDITIYGPNQVADILPDADIKSNTYLYESQVYGNIWEQLVLPFQTSLSGIDVLYHPAGKAPIIPHSKVPSVVCIHGLEWYYGYAPKIYSNVQKRLVRISAENADKIITVSEFSKEEIKNHLDIPGQKIEVVYNGVDIFYRNGNSKQWELPDKFLLFVGALTGRKNIHGLVNSFKRLKNQYGIDEKLVLIGPERSPNLKSIGVNLENLYLDSDIIIPGYVSKSELKYAYESASAFVFPSFHEAFGIAPLEAMACGTPVVASKYAALPEVLGDSANYFDPQNINNMTKRIYQTISETLTDEKQEELVEKSKQYDWDDSTRKTKQTLRNISK